jgi:hypothetical protein
MVKGDTETKRGPGRPKKDDKLRGLMVYLTPEIEKALRAEQKALVQEAAARGDMDAVGELTGDSGVIRALLARALRKHLER